MSSNPVKQLLKILLIISLVGGGILYPFLVYFALSHNVSTVILVLMSVILLSRVYISCRSKQYMYALLWLLGILILLTTGVWLAVYAAKLLPALINIALAVMFAKTILQGTPLIERIARLEIPNIPDDIIAYTHLLTKIWVVYFASQAVITCILAYWASNHFWAIYNGILIYIMLLLMFVIEYSYRKWRFRHVEIPTPLETIKSVIQHREQLWKN